MRARPWLAGLALGSVFALAPAPALASVHVVATYDPASDPSVDSVGVDFWPSLAGTPSDGVFFAWIRSVTAGGAEQVWVVREIAGNGTPSNRWSHSPSNGATSVAVTHNGVEPFALFTNESGAIELFRPSPVRGSDHLGVDALATPTRLHQADADALGFVYAGLDTAGNATFGAVTANLDFSLMMPAQVASVVGANAVSTAIARPPRGLFFAASVPGSTAVRLFDEAGAIRSTLLVASNPLDVALTSLALGLGAVALTQTTATAYWIGAGGDAGASPLVTTPTGGLVGEVAVARDYGGITAWAVGLMSSAMGRVTVQSGTDVVPTTLQFVPAGYSECARLSAASSGARPDTLYVSLACSSATGQRHVFLSVIQRDPPPVDAGDASVVDATVDAASAEDVSAGDATVDAAATDAIATIDAPRSGPDFRGSGCACNVPGGSGERPARRSVGAGLLALALGGVARRARRR